MAAILILFAVKYWNNSTVGQNIGTKVQITSDDVCASLEKAFNESTYTAWDYKSCRLTDSSALYLDVWDTTLSGGEKKLSFNDKTISSSQATTFCDLFYKTYPNLNHVVFRVLAKKADNTDNEIFVYDTTSQICSKKELDYIDGAGKDSKDVSDSSANVIVDNNNAVMSEELNIDKVEVETVEKTTVDIQQDAEKLRTETEY